MCSCNTAHTVQKPVQYDNQLLLQGGKQSEDILYVCMVENCIWCFEIIFPRGLCSRFVPFLAKIASKLCPAFYKREGSGE